MTTIFQVVMLSASLKLICARPSLSVSIEGCQSSVSGKYSRRRGVDICESPDLVTTFMFRDRGWLGNPITEAFTCGRLGAALTDTVSVTLPTLSSALTSVVL